MTDVWAGLAALAFGVASALVPILNAEAYIAASGALASRLTLTIIVVAMTIGTVAGKIVIFHGARAGKEYARVKGELKEEKPVGKVRGAIRRANHYLLGWLSHPWGGAGTVLLSGIVGIPPLFAVAALAGMSKQKLWVFILMVGLGRGIRFALLALAVAGIFEFSL